MHRILLAGAWKALRVMLVYMKKERLPFKPLQTLLLHGNDELSATFLDHFRQSKLRRFHVTRVRRLDEALDHLKSHHTDVVVMDLDLPDMRGLAAFDEVHRSLPNLPVVLVYTAFEYQAVEAVQSGAQEYVIGGLTTQRALVRAVLYAVTKVQDAKALSLQRQLLDNLMLNTPDRIFFKDKESRFIRISRATTEHFGLTNPDKAIGRTDFDFFTEEHARQAFEDEQEILSGGTPIIGKIEKETFPDGKIAWALTTKMPLLDEEGEVIGTFGISRDFTDQKNMEDALERERYRLNELTEELREKNTIFEEDMHMAREVQQALIPQEFRVMRGGHFGEIRIQPFYQPAESVGGDFIYFVPLDKDRLGVFICDVMGHGLRASMITAVLRGLLEELVRDTPDPGDFMTELNALLSRIWKSSNAVSLISAYYLLLDRNSSEVRLSNAGHPKPIRINKATGEISVFSSRDNDRYPALGVDETTQYVTGLADLPPEQTLLLYTDGLIEAGVDDGSLWGIEGLMRSLAGQHELPASRLLFHVMDAAKEFNRSPIFQDDICMIAVDRGCAANTK